MSASHALARKRQGASESTFPALVKPHLVDKQDSKRTLKMDGRRLAVDQEAAGV